jgi:hypothetical protein
MLSEKITRPVRAARPLALAAALLVALGACDRADDPDPMEDMPMEDMPMEEMPGMPMDPAMMERHADEGDEMAAQMRAHVQTMRQLPAEQQHERMAEHVGQVSAMLALMNRHMEEMSMGMPMADEQMGAMMGMSGEEHREMMQEMQALRAELENLQTAPPAELQERMQQHLDRCERMAEMMEHSAEHMRPG